MRDTWNAKQIVPLLGEGESILIAEFAPSTEVSRHGVYEGSIAIEDQTL